MKTRSTISRFLVALFAVVSTASYGKVVENQAFESQCASKPINEYVDATVADFPRLNTSSYNTFQLVSHGRPGQLLIDGKWRNAAQIASFLTSNSGAVANTTWVSTDGNTMDPTFNMSLTEFKYGCSYQDIDTDGDGIPNRLDLDSDGDSCPDAQEGGVSRNSGASGSMSASGGSLYTGGIPSGTANAIVGNGTPSQYSANGFFNGIETGSESGVYNNVYTYNQYALVLAINACTDSDGDGVANVFDIDDDNDGILDITEETCTSPQTSGKTGITVTKPGTINYNFNGTMTLSNLVDGLDGTNYVMNLPSGTLANSEWFRVEFPLPRKLTYWEIGHYTGQTLFTGTSTYKVQGSNDATNWTDLTGTLTYSNSHSGLSTQANNSNVAQFPSNTTAYKFYRYYGLGTVTASNGNVTEFYFKEITCADSDTDVDGIVNRLDLDSDGDTCPDAYEARVTSNPGTTGQMSSSGGAIYSGGIPSGTTDAYVGNGTPSQYGANGFFNGIEATPTESGVYNGSGGYFYSYVISSFINRCDDHDGDGIDDVKDIDDDNDGIVDAVESPACYYTANEWNTAVMPAYTVSVSSGLTTTLGNFNQLVDTVDNVTAVTFSASPTQAILNANVYLFTFVNPIRLSALYLEFNTATQFAGTTKIQGSNTNNGTDWTNLSAAIPQTAGTNVTVNGGVSIANSIKYPVTLDTAAYKYIRITGAAASNILAQNASEVYFDVNTAYYIPSSYPKQSCSNDTDSDGTINQWDLNSDNDGCSDAKEAGATTVSSVIYQFANIDGNSDGLVDSVDSDGDGIVNYISTYNPYALSAAIRVCTDTDGDGIPDLTDIDDDNDGVLDAVESPACFYTATEIKTAATVTSDFTYSASPNALSAIYDNSTTTFGQVPTATNILGKALYTLVLPTFNTQKIVSITDSVGATAFGAGTWILQGSIDGTTWDTLSAAQAMSTANTKYTFSNTLKPNTAYSRYRLFGATSTNTTANAKLQEININYTNYSASTNPKLTCTTDSDNDGIPNHRDLDSDGDKCPDAYEAGTYDKAGVTTTTGNVQNGSGGAVTSTASTVNAVINGPYSGNGFADILQVALPGDTNAYQYTYTYNLATDSTQKVCCLASGAAPTLSKTSDSVCSGSTYNLNSIVTGTTPAYNVVAWFTDNTHTTAVGTPAAATAGTYYAFYKDTVNNCFSAASVAFTFTVSAQAGPVGSASPQTICSGSTTAVSLNSTLSGTTYIWTAAVQSGSVSGFSNCTSACDSTIAQTLTGTGLVRYTVTPSANGCAGNSFTVDVTVAAVPTATIAYGGSPYLSGSGTANVTRTGQAGGTYSVTPSGLSINASTGQVNINSSFANTYTVKYIFSNGSCTDSTTATFIITPTNDTVTTTPACPTCPVTVCAVVDDVDTTGGATYSTPCGTPAGYTASVVSASGCVTYTPNGTVTDTARTCIVTCNNGRCDTTRVILYPPVPTNDTVTAIPSCPTCPVTVCAVVDDVNPTGATYSTPCGTPAGYTASVVSASGCVTYTSNGTVTDTARTCIVICNNGRCDTTMVILYPPVQTINHDWNVGFTNMPLTGNVSSNDQVNTNTTYDNIQANTNNPTTQIPVLDSNGTYTFTPSQPGNYTFIISVCAQGQSTGCPTQLLTINIADTTPSSTALPIANPDMVTTPYQTAIGIPTLDNDASGNYGGSLNPASVTIINAPAHGTIDSIGANGDIYYSPNVGFTGTDTLVYRVCDQLLSSNCDTAYQIITVLPLNAANTTAASDDYAYTLAGASTSGNVKNNDIDPEGNNLIVTPAIVTNTSGTFTLDDQGNYSFTPATNFVGSASYTYQVCDNGTPSACASATVHILVYPANTTPLPIKVIDFTGKALTDHSNQLNWKVAEVKDMDSYEILRSTDQKIWSSLGRIAANNKDGIQNMQLIDNNPDMDDFYRLVLHGQNGQSETYPKIVRIRRSKDAMEWVKLYPNPAETVVNLEYYSIDKDATLEINIMDVAGRKIKSVKQLLTEGSNVISINITGIADGMYNIHYANTANGKQDNIKFIKKTE